MAANNDGDYSVPPAWRTEVRVRKNGRKEKVRIERAEPEGLPPGWIKELKVTKSGNKVRKDPFYTDPVSGYIFRSMKDINRYLETGELGRLAFKPKDKGNHDDPDSETEKDQSPTPVKKPKIAGAESIPEAKDPIKVDEGNNSDKSVGLSTPAVGVVADKQTLESGDIEEETKKSKLGSKSKKKKVLELPRRSSKRLAGVALDPTPELKTNTRARQAVAKESGDEVPGTVTGVALFPTPELKTTTGGRGAVAKLSGDDVPGTLAGVALSSTPELKTTTGGHGAVAKQSGDDVPGTLAGVALDPTPELKTTTGGRGAVAKQSGDILGTVEGSKSTEDTQESSKSKIHSADLAKPKNAWKIITKCESSKKQEFAVDLPAQDQAKVETGGEAEAKQKADPPLDLPFGDLLSDPCIAFAIKTLTGDNFEASNGIEASMGSTNTNSEGITIPKENAGDQKQNLAIPGELSVNIIKNSGKTDEKKPELPLDSPFADILTDPCIEFAIKTLTGSIPDGGEPAVTPDNLPPQQLNSSQTQPSKNVCQTEFLSQQYNVLEKPATREQGRARNISMQKPGGAAGLRQPGENRFNECH